MRGGAVRPLEDTAIYKHDYDPENKTLKMYRVVDENGAKLRENLHMDSKVRDKKIPVNSYEISASKVVSSCNSPSKLLLTGQAFEHVPPQSTPCSPTSNRPFEHRFTGSGSLLLSTLEQLEIIKPKDDNKIIVNFKNLVFISS